MEMKRATGAKTMSHTLGNVRPETMIEQVETPNFTNEKKASTKICLLTRKPCLTQNCSLWVQIQPKPFWKLIYGSYGFNQPHRIAWAVACFQPKMKILFWNLRTRAQGVDVAPQPTQSHERALKKV